jgi:hypothetical protein
MRPLTRSRLKPSRLKLALLISCALAPVGAQEKVNQDSVILQGFANRVADYVKLHKEVRSQVQPMKQTDSVQAIQDHEHEMAQQIRERRHGVAQGNIFTPEISAEFHRLIGIAMRGQKADRIHESLKHAEPLRTQPIRVNEAYPAGVPLQSTPPSLLLNLPPLPPEVEYRVVGHDLILRDIEANVIVDFLGNAIP